MAFNFNQHRLRTHGYPDGGRVGARSCQQYGVLAGITSKAEVSHTYWQFALNHLLRSFDGGRQTIGAPACENERL